MTKRTCERDGCTNAIPERTGRGRPRKFCSRLCSTRHSQINNPRRCEVSGCSKPHVAKGMCMTHYNAKLGGNRHSRVITCEQCGKRHETTRSSSRYCSLDCYTEALTGKTAVQRQSEREAYALAVMRRRLSRAMNKALRQSSVAALPPAREVPCVWCGDDFMQPRGDARYCTIECRRRAKHVRRRGREYGAVGTYTWSEVVGVYLAIGKVCAYCHQGFPLCDIEPDHVIALSRGGANSITNVVPSCGPCNSDKRDLTLTEWAEDRRRRGLSERSLHSSIKHLTLALMAA